MDCSLLVTISLRTLRLAPTLAVAALIGCGQNGVEPRQEATRPTADVRLAEGAEQAVSNRYPVSQMASPIIVTPTTYDFPMPKRLARAPFGHIPVPAASPKVQRDMDALHRLPSIEPEMEDALAGTQRSGAFPAELSIEVGESMPQLVRLPAVSSDQVSLPPNSETAPASVPNAAVEPVTVKPEDDLISSTAPMGNTNSIWSNQPAEPAIVPAQPQANPFVAEVEQEPVQNFQPWPTAQPSQIEDEVSREQFVQDNIDTLRRLPAVATNIQEAAQDVHHAETTITPAEPAAPAPSVAQPEPEAPQAHVGPGANPMQAVNRRAEAKIRAAFDLAQRHAVFSARNELHAALRIVTQALDMDCGTREHSRALARGMKALEEANDFEQTARAGELDLKELIAAHQTPVLKDRDAESITPLIALQQYYTNAQEQLTLAGGGQATSSVVLYGLGRLEAAETGADADRASAHAMVYHQAALSVDPMNYKAANELGVMLARFGQYAQARDMLVHSVSVVPQTESWSNLAKVHSYLGQEDLARRAAHESQLAMLTAAGEDSPVRWVEPAALAGTIDGQTVAPSAAPRTIEPTDAPTSRNVSRQRTEGLMRFIPWGRRGE